jgi:hypothetical protein
MKIAIVSLLSLATLFVAILGVRNSSRPTHTLVMSSPAFPMDDMPYGQSFGEWTKDWWRHILSFPCDHQPLDDPQGLNVQKRQTGPVYFLPATNGGSASREVIIPEGKAILLSMVNMVYDYPCTHAGFGPDSGQTLESFLTEGARRGIDLAEDLTVILDGNEIPVSEEHRITSDMFYFTGNPSLVNCYDACITGESQAAVSDGYWMMLKPLEPGVHTLRFGGEIKDFFYDVDVTYHITVAPEEAMAGAF